MVKGYVFEVKAGISYSYIFAVTPKEAKEEFKLITGLKATSCVKRSKKITADSVKNTCVNLGDN